jgi:polysaccharide export outer membrane protein
MNNNNARSAKTGLFLSFVVLIALNACIPQKRIEYLYDKSRSTTEFDSRLSDVPTIKPGDELYIRVSSFDETTYNFFGTQAEGRAMNFPNELAISLISYSVDDSGSIYFPVLNKVHLGGQTIEEANETLRALLAEYFRQPNVIVSFVLKKIAVLGEVRMPGYYTYTNSRISIFQALGLAGDITVLGDKNTVLVIRENINTKKVTKNYLNLSDNNLFESEFYYLEPNDVLYVAPARARQWTISSVPFELVLTSLSTLILLLNYFNNN